MNRRNPTGTAIEIPHMLYLDLIGHLMGTGEPLTPGDIASEAIRDWLHARRERPSGPGYQWKDVFLPEGSELMFRHQQECFIAQVQGGQLIFQGQSVTPHGWMRELAGGKRNPWRDLYIRTSWRDAWTRASEWRGRPAAYAAMAQAPDRSQLRPAGNNG